MSYLNKQINEMLHAVLLPKLALEYDCDEKAFQKYRDQIQIALKNGNKSKAQRLQNALERQQKECDQIRSEN